MPPIDDTDFASFANESTRTPDKLYAGDFPRECLPVTLTGGAALVRGAVLGEITANGKFQLALAAAVDGSQNPKAILAEAADASGGDVQALAFFTGDFNPNALTFGVGVTAANSNDALRALNIFLRNIVDS